MRRSRFSAPFLLNLDLNYLFIFTHMSQDISESLHSLSPEKLDEWMRVLVRENIERIQTASALTTPDVGLADFKI